MLAFNVAKKRISFVLLFLSKQKARRNEMKGNHNTSPYEQGAEESK